MGNVLGGCKDSREPKNNADHGKPNTVTNHYTNTTALSGNDSKKTTEESCCKGTSQKPAHEEKDKKSAYPGGEIDFSESQEKKTETTCCKSQKTESA